MVQTHCEGILEASLGLTCKYFILTHKKEFKYMYSFFFFFFFFAIEITIGQCALDLTQTFVTLKTGDNENQKRQYYKRIITILQ